MGEMPRLGFIGLGLMGLPMALRLREAGHSLCVWNRSAAKAEAVQRAGASLAACPAAGARAAE
jgi:3-hydroxyisobutyrate dehydrogenase